MSRQYLRAAPILIACLALQANAIDLNPFDDFGGPAPAPSAPSSGSGKQTAPAPSANMPDFSKVLEENVLALVNAQQRQNVIAGIVFIMGVFALVNGAKFFRVLVVILVVAVFFVVALSQLKNNDWDGKFAEQKRLFAAAEVGLFFGAVAWKGWEGVQLVIGLLLGLYVAELIKAVAQYAGQEQAASQTAATVIIYTFGVLLGAYLVNDKFGAKRTFGILAPLFGSTLVVTAMAYTVLSAAPTLKIPNPPSVLSTWWAIILPNKFPFATFPFQARVGCTCVSVLLFLIAARAQINSAGKTVQAKEGLTAGLLDEQPEAVQELPK